MYEIKFKNYKKCHKKDSADYISGCMHYVSDCFMDGHRVQVKEPLWKPSVSWANQLYDWWWDLKNHEFIARYTRCLSSSSCA